MIVLIGIAFLAGVITAVSPCVFPVLPIIFAGGASGGRRRPYAIILGLVTTFVLSLLVVTWLLGKLGLPADLLRNIAIGLLFLVAATLVLPQLGELLARPFYRLTRRPAGDLGGGFLLGASLGLVFVPCGGPILGYITTQAASLDLTAKRVGLALAYALGAAVPMLALAIGGQRAAGTLRLFRRPLVRAGLGGLVATAAILMILNVDQKLQQNVSDYTSFLQRHVERTCVAEKRLVGTCKLPKAHDFTGIDAWINTPGGKPLSLASLHGKVVLVDFWTYSCINCLRTLPHLKALYAAYHKRGLEIVGVHTPEFAFEHVVTNVRKAVKDLGIRYPVAIDNENSTWSAYRNLAWPSEYLIDRNGQLRDKKEGEGRYAETEQLIRRLLGERGRPQLAVADRTPTGYATPESYLGYARLQRFWGGRVIPDQFAAYSFRSGLPQNSLEYAGVWNVGPEKILAGADARLRLHFYANDVYIVMGGQGRVRALVDGRPLKTIRVAGISRLYTVVHSPAQQNALLELRFSPKISAYSFTFG